MNNINIVGRLVRDPELKVSGDKQFARFTVAVNRRYKRDNQPDADFMDCTAFGKTAEIINQYVFKGSQIGITGRLESNKWKDKDGNSRTSWGIVVEELTFCESKSDRASAPASEAKPATESFMEVPADDLEGLPFL